MKQIVLLNFLAALFVSCGTPETEQAPEPWVSKNPVEWPQFLLMNEAYFTGERILFGASAFLVTNDKDTFVCTAKHLLGPDGGVSPALENDQVNSAMIRWKLYTRSQAKDTFYAGELLNAKRDPADILLLKLEKGGSSVLPLHASLESPGQGERCYIVGCEYKEEDCLQNVFAVNFAGNFSGRLKFTNVPAFELPGFSGAPVLNKSGRVIGVLTAGDGAAVYATPLSEVGSWLK